eukprot:gene8944-9684_t
MMRITFWIKVMIPTVIDSTLMMLLFYLPVWLNFTGISLLCVFYANTIFEDKYGHWPKYICIVLNIIFGILNITIGSLVESASTNQDAHVVMYDCYIYYAVFIDALIALLVGFLGYYFVYDHHYHSYRHWVLLPRSIETFSIINWLIVFCFFIRSIFVFVFSLPVIKQSASTEIQFNGNHPVTSVLMLFFFLITEWVPNSSMLYLLWKSNTKNKRHSSKKYQSEQYLNGGGDGQSPSSSNLAKTFSFHYRLVSIFSNSSSHHNSSSNSLPSVLSYDKTPPGSQQNSRKLKKSIEDVKEDEQDEQRQTLLSENDLIDQGLILRNPSKDDSVIRVYYNSNSGTNSRTNSSIFTPPSTINLQESGIMEERISDYGQHTNLDDEVGYSPSAPYFPPPINSARHYPSQTRPTSSLFKNQSNSHQTNSSIGSRGNKLPEENIITHKNQPNLPIQTNKVAFSANSTSSQESLLHLPPSSSSTFVNPNNTGAPAQPSSTSSLANHYNKTKRPSWNKGQAVISSLYLHPSSQNITRVPSSAKIHNGETENNLETPPTPLSSKHKSFSSTTSAPHLDPSAIFKVVNEEEEFEQYDLNEKYADTIGPRDILQSKYTK